MTIQTPPRRAAGLVASLLVLAGCAGQVPVLIAKTGEPPVGATARQDQSTERHSFPLGAFERDYHSDYAAVGLVALRLYREADARDWHQDVAPLRWNDIAIDLIQAVEKSPPRAARSLALIHLAVLQALLQARGGEAGPAQATLKEEAAIAYAAAGVLGTLYPALQAPVQAEAYRKVMSRSQQASGMSDIGEGIAIGRAVAERVLAFARTDNADAPPAPPLAQVPGQYYNEKPLDPTAGLIKPFVISPIDAYRAPPPPRVEDPVFHPQITVVRQAQRRLTPAKKQNAVFWAAVLPPFDLNRVFSLQLAERKVGVVAAARALAWFNIAQTDALIACWRTKYRYLLPRPFQAIPGFTPWIATDEARSVYATLGLPATDHVLFGTPPHPSYPSGHAVRAGAAAEYVASVLPDQAAFWNAMVLASGLSRIDAGIHWPIDYQAGVQIGRRIAGRVVAYEAVTGGQYLGRPYEN